MIRDDLGEGSGASLTLVGILTDVPACGRGRGEKPLRLFMRRASPPVKRAEKIPAAAASVTRIVRAGL